MSDVRSAENVRLQSLIERTAQHWLDLQLTHSIAWEGGIDEAMKAACDEIRRLRASPEVDLLAACKAQHEAIDRLFCQLILLTREHTPNEAFFPSKSGQPWEAAQLGATAIRKAEEQVDG